MSADLLGQVLKLEKKPIQSHTHTIPCAPPLLNKFL